MLDLVAGDQHRAIFDVLMRLVAAAGVDAQRVLLVFAGEGGDFLGDGGGKQQRSAAAGRCLQDELQLFAEAEIEHLIRLVQHDDLAFREVQIAALDVILQPAGGADDDVTS